MEDNPLTEEQRQLAADNHNLIYSFAKFRGLDLEEYYGILAIGLCKAAKAYDKTQGTKFSILAYVCMFNECKQQWILENRKKRIPQELIISYDSYVTDPISGNRLYFSEILIGSEDVQYDITQDLVKHFYDGLTDNEKLILKLLTISNNENAIADRLRVSRQYVNKTKQTLRKKWNKYLRFIKTLEKL